MVRPDVVGLDTEGVAARGVLPAIGQIGDRPKTAEKNARRERHQCAKQRHRQNRGAADGQRAYHIDTNRGKGKNVS